MISDVLAASIPQLKYGAIPTIQNYLNDEAYKKIYAGRDRERIQALLANLGTVVEEMESILASLDVLNDDANEATGAI